VIWDIPTGMADPDLARGAERGRHPLSLMRGSGHSAAAAPDAATQPIRAEARRTDTRSPCRLASRTSTHRSALRPRTGRRASGALGMADPDLARQLTVDAAMVFPCAWPALRAYRSALGSRPDARGDDALAGIAKDRRGGLGMLLNGP
jgi:hypothetical protein